MNIDLLVAQCQSMQLLLNDRLGDANPWSALDFAGMDAKDLGEAKRLMHELLYAPPRRT